MELMFNSLDEIINLGNAGIKKPFGKKNKTPSENAACFFINLLEFIEHPEQRKGEKQLKKYIERLYSMVMVQQNEEVKYELARNKSIILAFFKILKNFHVFEFETRKRLIIIFKELAKLKDFNNKSDMLTSFSNQTNLDELVRGLIEASKCNDQVLGCAGKVLKLFAKSKETFWVYLNLDLFHLIFNLCSDNNLQIASEYQEILETLVFKVEPKQRKKVGDFLYNIYNYVFLWISQKDCLFFKRTILNLLYRLMCDPLNNHFRRYFINHKERIVMTMKGLTDANESICFESYLLLGLFLKNFDDVVNNEVRTIILNNKTNLLLALSNINPEAFDVQCEYGVCRDELEQILRNFSAGI
jgi:hypothetical protein